MNDSSVPTALEAEMLEQPLSHKSVRSSLQAYLDEKVDLQWFHCWLVAEVGLGESDDDLRQLVRAIRLRISEYVYGHWDEEELRGQLATLDVPPIPDEPEEAGTVQPVATREYELRLLTRATILCWSLAIVFWTVRWFFASR